MRISELSARTGASARSLRYYEEVGLLTPARTGNGYRDYAETDVARVWQIRWLFQAGVSSAKVGDVLHLVCGQGADVCVDPALHVELASTRALLAEHVERLTTTLDRLDALLQMARTAPPPAQRVA